MIRALLTIPAMFVGAGCQTVNFYDDARIVKNDGSEIVFVSLEMSEYGFDADSGDTVVVIMSPANYPDSIQQCEDMGGEFAVTNRVDYCVGIDF